ncbi:hypothetical protein PoB_004587900 [Plakobranchus ocellatus]|uniref:Uncharacterized protein n=1 Tax=Plakobranchus ocellatus TaxID=259542 RepID=A0AAV4BKC2_9GAST|nr:hypothetical protein PoB_004587900 [Plakobranchus ocellatus]
MLRDCFVCGINDTRLLLSEKDLRFLKALEIAQAMGATTEGASDIGPTTRGEVNYSKKGNKHLALRREVNNGNPNETKTFSEYSRCGGPHHKD